MSGSHASQRGPPEIARGLQSRRIGDEAYLAELAALGVLPDIARKLDGKHDGNGEAPAWRAPLQAAFLKRLFKTNAKRRGESFAQFEMRYRSRPARQG